MEESTAGAAGHFRRSEVVVRVMSAIIAVVCILMAIPALYSVLWLFADSGASSPADRVFISTTYVLSVLSSCACLWGLKRRWRTLVVFVLALGPLLISTLIGGIAQLFGAK